MKRDEYRALGKRLLRPERPRLAEARAAVAGITDAREAWEVLVARGFVPHDEVGVPHRRFRGQKSPWGPSPATTRAAAVVAADFAGVMTAERLALEFLAAARPLGVVAAERFWWHTGWPRSKPAGIALHAALEITSEALMSLVEPAFADESIERVWPIMRASGFAYAPDEMEGQNAAEYEEWFAAGATNAAAYERVWDEGARRDLRLPSDVKGIAKAARGAPLAELENPFTPLLALWATGYGIDLARDEGLDLVCPRVMQKKARDPK